MTPDLKVLYQQWLIAKKGLTPLSAAQYCNSVGLILKEMSIDGASNSSSGSSGSSSGRYKAQAISWEAVREVLLNRLPEVEKLIINSVKRNGIKYLMEFMSIDSTVEEEGGKKLGDGGGGEGEGETKLERSATKRRRDEGSLKSSGGDGGSTSTVIVGGSGSSRSVKRTPVSPDMVSKTSGGDGSGGGGKSRWGRRPLFDIMSFIPLYG